MRVITVCVCAPLMVYVCFAVLHMFVCISLLHMWVIFLKCIICFLLVLKMKMSSEVCVSGSGCLMRGSVGGFVSSLALNGSNEKLLQRETR